jgi:hypothetical protein
MPSMTVRRIQDAPPPDRSTKAIRDAHQEYEGFINAINGDVGELELYPHEQPRSVKVRLRRAATRLGREIDIWDVGGRVYFRVEAKRGRPRKQKA